MRKELTDKINLEVVARNYKDGTEVNVKLTLLDKDKKELKTKEDTAQVQNYSVKYPFITEDLAKSLTIDPNDVAFVEGWIDTDGDGEIDYGEAILLEIIQEKGLTVFLGGAGMRGDYQYDFIKALKEAGISNVVRGNYSAYFTGYDENYHELVDTVADSSAVMFYNQDTKDPVGLQFVDTRGCEVGKELEFLNMKYISYKGKTIKDEECPNTFRFELDTTDNIVFDLKSIEVNEEVPEKGQFNFIGYSWGAVIAARTAVAYADDGIEIDNLVLIGAPINYSLLQAVQNNPNIKNVIIENLTEYGDPIYAGMTDAEILQSAIILMPQMNNSTGHFHYSAETDEGSLRRRKLSKILYNKGLK